MSTRRAHSIRYYLARRPEHLASSYPSFVEVYDDLCPGEMVSVEVTEDALILSLTDDAEAIAEGALIDVDALPDYAEVIAKAVADRLRVPHERVEVYADDDSIAYYVSVPISPEDYNTNPEDIARPWLDALAVTVSMLNPHNAIGCAVMKASRKHLDIRPRFCSNCS